MNIFSNHVLVNRGSELWHAVLVGDFKRNTMTMKMDITEFVKRRVAEYYWKDDINCAETSLKILSEFFELPLNEQVINSVLALPGAGQCGAQCGIVSGTIMFMGIFGKRYGIDENTIKDFCKNFARTFETEFKSLQCHVLRPEGFHPDNPPHICESLTCDAVNISVQSVTELQAQCKILYNRQPGQ